MGICPKEIIELLPWYVNQTLDDAAKADVERHLAECSSCRRRVEGQRALQGVLAARPQEAMLPRVENVLDRLAPQPPAKLDWRWVWALIVTQARMIRRDIWIASALVMALGTLITVFSGEPHQMALGALPLVWAAPVVAAAGVAFLYGPSVAPAIEIELTAPVSPRLILLARLMLTFGFDLLLGLGGSTALALANPHLSLWPLVATWLAPMAFLSSLAFLLTVLTADPNVGFLVSLGVWAVQSTAEIAGRGALWFIPGLTAAARPWLWILALLLGGLALWAGGREERWIRGRA
ncbi:MAG: zf-HC2 domain-containing protein [Anaerolineae bacterium]|nr:zf-HC2 domain-containing protein [Anaerolineae bacterium]